MSIRQKASVREETHLRADGGLAAIMMRSIRDTPSPLAEAAADIARDDRSFSSATLVYAEAALHHVHALMQTCTV